MATPVKTSSPLKMVREYFGMNLAQMKAEWTTLPQSDKDAIIGGITPDADGNRTETY